jgi:predicted ATPase/DNA-binding XRE family transcriptional regulator
VSELVSFGELLCRRRRALDLTQQQLAERVGCATTTIVKFENETRRPSREMAERLAEILQVSVVERAAFLQAARRKEPAVARNSSTSDPELAAVQRPHVSALPVPALPLLGRDGEIAVLRDLFRRPGCRLVTIVGPGGIGKTRLALQAAAELAQQFVEGVAFVGLASLASVDALLIAMAEATGCSFEDTGDVRRQLVDHLRPKRMLVLLDSIEHLLDHGAAFDVVADLLERVPGLALLVTSRERLSLQREWVFELQGLSTPPLPRSSLDDATQDQIEVYPSASLFLHHARRLRPGFAATPAESAAIARICQAVEGLPLAIELSAAWTPTLSCVEIADEIQSSIDFLSAAVRDLPPRHRSMRVVFDHSWRLLAESEQQVMRRLAVFRGGFTRKAAEHVAGATLSQLSSLVAKSLVRRTAEGRYDLHELIGQYSTAQLKEAGEEAVASHAHAEYYLAFAANSLGRLQGAGQRQALDDLHLDLDNLRAAWNWAATHGLVGPVRRAAWAFWYFLDLRNLYREVADSFGRAEQALVSTQALSSGEAEIAIAQIRTWRAFAGFRLGLVSEGRRLLAESMPVLRRQAAWAELADALWVDGLLSWLSGDFGDAAQSLEESLTINQALARRWQLVFVPLVLGAVRHEQGVYAEAYVLLRTGLDRCLELGVPRNTAFALGLLARTVRVLGYQDDLHVLMAEHLRLAAEMDDRSAMAFVMENMALAIQSGDDPEAARLYLRQAADIYVDLGDMWSASRTLSYAGQFELSQGNVAEARQHFRRALQTAQAGQSDTNLLDALVGLAEVAARQDAGPLTYALALTVGQHPASNQSARDRAARLTGDLAGRSDVAVQAQTLSLEDAVAAATRP